MKAANTIVIVAGLGALGIAGYFLYDQFKKAKLVQSNATQPQTQVTESLSPQANAGGTNLFDFGVAAAGTLATYYQTHPGDTEQTKGSQQQQTGTKKDMFGNTIAIFN